MSKEFDKDEGSLLARIDERTLLLVAEIQGIKDQLNSKYVSREEFKPVKTIVYGFVALVLTSVIGALITLVLKSN